MASEQDDGRFRRFKAVCVPILGSSKLTPSTIPVVSSHLSQLVQLLRELDPLASNPAFISYVFFPLSSILQRNLSSEIPDQILEKILISLGILCENWWWSCEPKIWEQVFMLCGAVVGGLESKGKERARDEETKEAAIRCMLALLHERSPEDAVARSLPAEEAHTRSLTFRDLTRSARFVPIIGQTIDSLLATAISSRLSLQQASLEVLALILDIHAPEDLVPTVLPGVASGMTKVCLGLGTKKGWTNGEAVAAALKVLRVAIIKAISDEICMKEGALPRFENLEDLASFGQAETTESQPQLPSYATARTPSWLRGTTTQLHIAINSLNPLVKHPTPSALYALVDFSSEVTDATSLTLPQTQPLLLSFLLSLSNSEYPRVGEAALSSLRQLLSTSNRRSDLLQMLMQMTAQNLSSLPRFLSSQSDSKIQHVAEMVTAVCRIALSPTEEHALTSISKAIGKLLGPGGGIEKWGWSLLSVLEFIEPTVTITHTSSEQLMLENNEDISWVPFPELSLKTVSSRDAKCALEDMFRALGQAGGDSSLFSVEWFTDVGRSGTRSRNVAAMWCACRLLEGVGRVTLSSESGLGSVTLRRSKRAEKQSRSLARIVAELWDKSDFDEVVPEGPSQSQGPENLEFDDIQHRKGLVPLHATLKITQAQPLQEQRIRDQPVLHRGLCLQLIAISAGILQSRFNSLFIFALYPILHSIVSTAPFLSSSGLAALNYVTIATSYASPANLLLSNFDYALDSVSRRLTRRWLDIDATKVLVILIRLVGPEVVDKAGDVVEECFDRLDTFHGYGIIVHGLIEVLTEVLNVIEMDGPPPTLTTLDSLLQWLPDRKVTTNGEEEQTDFGPAPRKAWGPEKEPEDDEGSLSGKQPESDEAPPTPSQALTKQIIARSIYFLTHESPAIRARILVLLSLAVPVLSDSSLLPAIHDAWPFILNRLGDQETFVVGAAAGLVEALVTHVGSFMYRRIWDDVWPRFQTILKQLEVGDSGSALARRRHSAVGTESAYTHSHRLYRSVLRTMTGVMEGVQPYEPSFWDSLVLFRRFLGQHVHEELQACARQLYLAAGKRNADSVWLVLQGTAEDVGPQMKFMYDDRWKVEHNVRFVLSVLGV
ncbi:hypothetical protein H1R20_g6592, partial [Candolleomyces eurysporus]